MVISALVLLGLGAGIGPLHAQTGTNTLEQQRWRAVLPAVIASTDCFANEALKYPTIADAVAREALNSILVEISRTRCNEPFRQMIASYDRVYGRGTGWSFANGAYRADLPRAVVGRIKSELDRRLVEAQRLDTEREAERHKQLTTLENARDLLRDRMYECTGKALAQLLRSKDTSEVLATAALTICSGEIGQLVEAGLSVQRAKSGQGSAAEQFEVRERSPGDSPSKCHNSSGPAPILRTGRREQRSIQTQAIACRFRAVRCNLPATTSGMHELSCAASRR